MGCKAAHGVSECRHRLLTKPFNPYKSASYIVGTIPAISCSTIKTRLTQETHPDDRAHRTRCFGLADAGRLPRLQRNPLRPHRRPRRCPAHRPCRRRPCVHGGVHGKNGRFHQTVLPGIPAGGGVRQADRAVRFLPLDCRRRHPPARHPPGDAGNRTGLCPAHLRRCFAVRGGVRGVPVRRRNVPSEQHPQTPDPGHHRPGRILVHHGRPARHPTDPEHHPQHLLQHHCLGRTVAGPDRHAVRVLYRHGLPAAPAQQGPARR